MLLEFYNLKIGFMFCSLDIKMIPKATDSKHSSLLRLTGSSNPCALSYQFCKLSFW